MLGGSVALGEVRTASAVGGSNGLLVVVGMTGEVRGAVAITFPTSCAVNIANRVLGTTKSDPDGDVSDAVAEITNMIAGGAKARLSSPEGPPVQLGLPMIIRDMTATLDFPALAQWTVMPFAGELGEFTLFVSFEDSRA